MHILHSTYIDENLMTPPPPVGAPNLVEFDDGSVKGLYRTNLTDALPHINSTNVSAVVNMSFIFRVEDATSSSVDYFWLVSHHINAFICVVCHILVD